MSGHRKGGFVNEEYEKYTKGQTSENATMNLQQEVEKGNPISPEELRKIETDALKKDKEVKKSQHHKSFNKNEDEFPSLATKA